MIVKNEASVIRRCLESVRPLISHWLIVDTGSTDGTQDIIKDCLHDLPGELTERPWQDFAHNRSEALALARPLATYSLIVDADDTFEVPAAFRLPALNADSYTIDIRDGPLIYQRSQFVRNTLPWRYVGILHEFLSCADAKSASHMSLTMVRNHDGARRRDPNTYRKDAALLERALQNETDLFLRSRYTFYLAQSYRDCGEREKASALYLERAELKFWDQEVYVALCEAAKLMAAMDRPFEEVLHVYERATMVCPSRIEAAHGAARLCRLKNEFARGFAIAKAVRERTEPPSGLFVESWVYNYGLDDELSVLAYWSGHDIDCAEAAARALASRMLPAAERPRLEANRRFALDRIAKAAAAESSSGVVGWAPARPQGGTELMVEALRKRLGPALDTIDLCVNGYFSAERGARPLVVWFHHDVDQAAVQWCRDAALTSPVARFVFVSHWQRERYATAFGLPPERCVVIQHALESAPELRHWEPASIYRCAYISTPFRGLDILLDVWERLPAGKAELHVWSSMQLYAMDEGPYRLLLERARTMEGVVYHGLAPNAELRAALRTMHFLTYPNTFSETACLSAIEAMSAGCRIIVPSHGALPETTGGYARVYPWSPDKAVHADLFSRVLAEEFAAPWDGRIEEALHQQAHCATVFSWDRRLKEWQRLIASLQETVPLNPARPITNLAALPRAATNCETPSAPARAPQSSVVEHGPSCMLEHFDRQHPVTMDPEELASLIRSVREAPDDALMVEWGSGASTLRWLREMRASQRLISIEHNRNWYDRVRAVLDNEPELAQRIQYHLCPANGYFDHGYGYPAEENPVGLDDYFNANPEVFDADIFLIDGVARGVCAMLVHRKATKPNAQVYLHDWWPRRPWYSWATSIYASADRVGETLCRLTR